MTTLISDNRKVVVDEEGFLIGHQPWDEKTAEILAEHEGVDGLDDEKMKIIKFMRKYYYTHKNFPILGNVCRNVGATSKDCVTQEFIDPMKAWKIAGLPKPPNVFFTSFDDKKYVANPFY